MSATVPYWCYVSEPCYRWIKVSAVTAEEAKLEAAQQIKNGGTVHTVSHENPEE